jgi:hypothetical protein
MGRLQEDQTVQSQQPSKKATSNLSEFAARSLHAPSLPKLENKPLSNQATEEINKNTVCDGSFEQTPKAEIRKDLDNMRTSLPKAKGTHDQHRRPRMW